MRVRDVAAVSLLVELAASACGPGPISCDTHLQCRTFDLSKFCLQNLASCGRENVDCVLQQGSCTSLVFPTLQSGTSEVQTLTIKMSPLPTGAYGLSRLIVRLRSDAPIPAQALAVSFDGTHPVCYAQTPSYDELTLDCDRPLDAKYLEIGRTVTPETTPKGMQVFVSLSEAICTEKVRSCGM